VRHRYSGRQGAVGVVGRARVMSHDFTMISSEDHDFNLGWHRRSEP